MEEKKICEKCNENEVGARLLGFDVCIVCYDKFHDALPKPRF